MKQHSVLFQCEERAKEIKGQIKEIHNHNRLNCISYFRAGKNERDTHHNFSLVAVVTQLSVS